MSKYTDAFDYILTATNGGDGITKEMNDLRELIELSVPKKIELENDWNCLCPNCKRDTELNVGDFEFDPLTPDYCKYCGQRLDFSGLEDYGEE